MCLPGCQQALLEDEHAVEDEFPVGIVGAIGCLDVEHLEELNSSGIVLIQPLKYRGRVGGDG